ncbi:MAG: hypothetical protein ACTSR5_06005 [Promethearchaeota archaeon]
MNLIVIFIDNVENFLQFIEKEIILHFLAKIENNLILYETKQTIVKTKNSDMDTQLVALQKIISQVDESLVLVKGKIREIFLSYSS